MYKLTMNGTVIALATGEEFGKDSKDPRWRAYRAWLADGNTPEPADPEEKDGG